MDEKRTAFQTVLRFLNRMEDLILVGLLTLMIFTAASQILLRNLFSSGMVWADGLIRMLVLWMGLAGAMIASRDGNHIRIDLAARFLPSSVRRYAAAGVEGVTALLCGLMAWHSYRFVKMEAEFSTFAFSQIPAWICESIIPFAFLVIGLRYLNLSLKHMYGCEIQSLYDESESSERWTD